MKKHSHKRSTRSAQLLLSVFIFVLVASGCYAITSHVLPEALIAGAKGAKQSRNSVTLSASPTSGSAPATITFTEKATNALYTTINYGDGTTGTLTAVSTCTGCALSATGTHTYTAAGAYTAKVMDGSSTMASVSITVTGTALRTKAAARNFLVGTAADAYMLGNAAYAQTLAREYNMLTPEFELQTTYIHPQQGTYYFSDVDKLANFAKNNKMVMYGDWIVEGKNFGQPDWLTYGNFTGAQKYTILKDHITTILSHFVTKFPGLFKYWIVVNEAMGDDAQIRTDSIWNNIGASPTDYIRLSFEWARAADPSAKLYYNDYDSEEAGTPKSDAVYTMLKNLKAAGVPIDGVGLQIHRQITESIDVAALRTNIQRLGALGLEVQITENDEWIYTQDGVTSDELALQAQQYGAILSVCLAEPACKGYSTWGFTDARSWVPDWFPGYGSALPFDANYRAKPAYTALLNAFGQ